MRAVRYETTHRGGRDDTADRIAPAPGRCQTRRDRSKTRGVTWQSPQAPQFHTFTTSLRSGRT